MNLFLFLCECNHVISSMVELNGSLQHWTTATGMLSFQEHSWVIGSQIISHKGVFWEASSRTQRNGSFRTKTSTRNKTHWTSTFPYFNHLESWAAVITSVIIILLMLCYRLVRTSKEMVGCVTTTATTTLVLTLTSCSFLVLVRALWIASMIWQSKVITFVRRRGLHPC